MELVRETQRHAPGALTVRGPSAARRRRGIGALAALTITAGWVGIAAMATRAVADGGESFPEVSAAISLAPGAPRDESTDPPPPVRTRAHVQLPDLPRVTATSDEPVLEGPPTETPESVQRSLVRRSADAAVQRVRSLDCRGVTAWPRRLRPASITVDVGLDGRVQAATVDRSTGDPRADRALQKCAAAWGPFPLAIIDGRVVDSSQLIDWPPASLRDPAPIEQPTS